MGFVAWIDKVDQENSVIVTMLERAGAVFYVKTSVPQSLMVCEAINNVFGRTTNPLNKNWSCGGSTGGEGAIVGFRGSVMGVGTDIGMLPWIIYLFTLSRHNADDCVGGSIRVPAAFNNHYGIRPSHGRLPYAKMANSMEGQETIHSVVGPMCHSIEDMRLFMTAVLKEQPWDYDSKVVPMPWRTAEEDAIRAKLSSGGLSIGIFNCDGNVSRTTFRSRLAKDSVNRPIGHPSPAYSPSSEDGRGQAQGCWPQRLSLGPVQAPLRRRPRQQDLRRRRRNRKLTPAIETKSANHLQDIFATLNQGGEPAIPNISDLVNPNLPKLTLNDAWAIQLEKWNYQMEYLAKIKEFEAKTGRELDAIIAPITATAAIRHNQFKYYGYATAINVLDFTSVVVPVTFADKGVDVRPEGFKPLTEMDATVNSECKLRPLIWCVEIWTDIGGR